MRRDGRWIDARDLEDGCASTSAKAKTNPAATIPSAFETVADFVLDPADRALVLNETEEAICWGHGRKDTGLAHEFYSDKAKVLGALCGGGLERTADGVYVVSRVVRSGVTGRVVGFA